MPPGQGSDVQASVSVLTARRRADALFLTPPPGTAAPPRDPDAPTARSLGESALAIPPEPPPPSRAADAAAPAPLAPAGAGASVGAGERIWAAVRDRLPLWAQTRCGLAPRSLAALCVVLLVATGFTVRHFWAGRPRSVPAPALAEGPASATPGTKSAGGGSNRGARREASAMGSPPTPVANTEPSPAGVLVVDVGGKVLRPGIYRLPAGSRVADALTVAGGVREGTDLTGLNRARLLADGEQVLAGVPGGGAPVAGAGGAGRSGRGGTGTGPSGPVSLNSASADQLDALPGVGPVLAQHIVDYRTQHGGFRSVGELREVKGIGEGRFNDLQALVRL
ncbi:ComEA family DNA-binding protein [Streptomyces sp. Edi4]|uniref:ComEA family DNA-binding protein n=1 Tax=Streptomyces sp. Edi4 TaxID=3162527 RepID=UPI0033055F09